MNEHEIKQRIEAGLPESQVEVSGDGRHFEAVVVSPAFAGRSMLEQHRMVYASLGDSFQSEALHALSVKTYTPEAWKARAEK
ncbi:MAG: BolA family protein [Gammaproteobacteria bacterium]|nr:BolA family protein [Gammaproteobacteria bacterium]MDJ0891215.1 BolA family protein [Gammaproteobacteria bacterium]